MNVPPAAATQLGGGEGSQECTSVLRAAKHPSLHGLTNPGRPACRTTQIFSLGHPPTNLHDLWGADLIVNRCTYTRPGGLGGQRAKCRDACRNRAFSKVRAFHPPPASRTGIGRIAHPSENTRFEPTSENLHPLPPEPAHARVGVYCII